VNGSTLFTILFTHRTWTIALGNIFHAWLLKKDEKIDAKKYDTKHRKISSDVYVVSLSLFITLHSVKFSKYQF